MTRKTCSARPIPLCDPEFTGDEWREVRACLESGWVSSLAPHTTQFAEAFASEVGARHAVPVTSGTAALHLALRAVGVAPGDRVLVPTLSFIASVNPIRYLGAEPVFIDSERATFNLDPAQAVAKIRQLADSGRRPAAVVIVHLYGHAAEAEPILLACSEYNIPVVEDAAEALGTTYHTADHEDRSVGTLGKVGCFSFNGNKLITAGGGGMVVTDDSRIADRVAYLADQAKDGSRCYVHHEIGYNYRLSGLQAAFGLAQLRHIDHFVERKRQHAARYTAALGQIRGIITNPEAPWCRNCFWNYALLIDAEQFGLDAATVVDRLLAQQIHCRPFFPPVHTLPPYRTCETTSTVVAESLSREGVLLPSSVGLTDEQQQRVIGAIAALAAQ